MPATLPVVPLTPPVAAARGVDLLRWPLVGRVLRWRRLRTAVQLVLIAVAAVVVAHGLFGHDLAPRNLATVLSWIHYRGLLIGALVLVGNVFCGACPMILVRDLGRRLHPPVRHWPKVLSNKRLALPLFALVLFAYERFDLWALPSASAWLVVGYFLAALAVDVFFRGAAFCRHVCPVGQFNFIASTLSPLEVRVRDRDACRSCTTADCIKGRSAPDPPRSSVQRGCELGLFLPSKVGNLDCTFCLDCVHACPHDNVAIGVRLPGEELADDRRRSSIGRLSRRGDLAALAVLFTFGALLNAFAMTGPVYAAEMWLSETLQTRSETLVIGLIFVMGLAVLPAIVCTAAAAGTRLLAPSSRGPLDVMVRFAYALVPLGVGVWLAHYGFHLLTGGGTAIPVAQSAVVEFTGRAWLGAADWSWIGLQPGTVFPFQAIAVLLGAIGSLAVAGSIAERDYGPRALRAAVPWGTVVIGLASAAMWILSQPMEMRGTGLG
jgi:polyferredoxin